MKERSVRYWRVGVEESGDRRQEFLSKDVSESEFRRDIKKAYSEAAKRKLGSEKEKDPDERIEGNYAYNLFEDTLSIMQEMGYSLLEASGEDIREGSDTIGQYHLTTAEIADRSSENLEEMLEKIRKADRIGPFKTLEEANDALKMLIAERALRNKSLYEGRKEKGLEKQSKLTEEEQKRNQEAITRSRELSKQYGPELDKVAKDWMPQIVGGNRNADVSPKDCEEAERENREWERKRRVRKH